MRVDCEHEFGLYDRVLVRRGADRALRRTVENLAAML